MLNNLVHKYCNKLKEKEQKEEKEEKKEIEENMGYDIFEYLNLWDPEGLNVFYFLKKK